MKQLHAFSPLLLAAAVISAPAWGGDMGTRASSNPQATQWTAVFTGQHVDGAPVYRLPAITVVADRKVLANEVQVYRLPPIIVVAERRTPTAKMDGRQPQVEQEARAKPGKRPT